MSKLRFNITMTLHGYVVRIFRSMDVVGRLARGVQLACAAAGRPRGSRLGRVRLKRGERYGVPCGVGVGVPSCGVGVGVPG